MDGYLISVQSSELSKRRFYIGSGLTDHVMIVGYSDSILYFVVFCGADCMSYSDV
jgi:hypothetical protein